MGPDGIRPRVLNELADVITGPLSILLQWSGESGEVPGAWNLPKVVPLFQKGKKEDAANDRPVSLTSVPGRRMEKAVLGDTENPLRDNAAIGHSQQELAKGKSCRTN